MHRPIAIFITCLGLLGCSAGQDLQQAMSPPPPEQQAQAAAPPVEPEDYDCSVGIPGKLLSVTSHNEMVARFGKPTTEVTRPAGGTIASYAKIDFRKVKGCRPMAPGSKAANRIQNIQFVFEADGSISTVNTNAPIPE